MSRHRESARRRRTLVRVLASVVALFIGLAPLVVGLRADAVTVHPGVIGNFEQDGNLTVDQDGRLDWANVDPTVVIDDTLDSGFQGSSKEEDPASWKCDTGGADPSKANILRAYVKPRISGSEAWLDLAYVRQSGLGDTHVNFEFNRNAPPPGSECEIDRQPGDFLVTYDFPGGSDPADIRAWRWSGTNWVDLPLSADDAKAATNSGTISDPIAGGSAGPREFGEATLDLLAPSLPPDLVGCPGFGYVNIRSRSSHSITSALQDRLPTTALDLNTCGKVIVHKVDDHVPPQPLAGAVFGLYTSAGSQAPVMTCTTVADGTCTFDQVIPGTYFVKEVSAPAGYSPSTVVKGPITVAFRETVDIAEPFVNPRDVGRIKIVKKLVDDQSTPVVPVDLSVLDGASFVVYVDANANNQFDAGEAAKLWPAQTDDATCTIGGGAGYCEVGPLPVGPLYRVHETHAPDGTSAVADIAVPSLAKDQTVEVEYSNRIPPIQITMLKTGPARVHVGDTIDYEFRVSTSGPRLHDVQVDELVPDRCDGPLSGPVKAGGDQDAFLEVGEAWTWSCGHVATASDPVPLPNQAKATGTDDFGRTVAAVDSHSVDILKPAITLDKKVNGGNHSSLANALLAHPGDDLGYTIVITNTGDTSLEIMALADTLKSNLGATCDKDVGDTLAAGAHTQCAYTMTAAADAHNVAAVAGVDVLGGPKGTVTASDETFVVVLDPGVKVEKSGAALAHTGDTVTFTFEVTNTGNTTLTNIDVTDDVIGPIGTIPALATGASTTLSKDYLIPSSAPDPLVNCVAVKGIDALGREVIDQDCHTTDLLNPAITLDKKVNGGDHKPAASALMAHAGDDLGYTVVVRNTSDTALEVTALADSLRSNLGASCDKGVGDALAVGAELSCEYTMSAQDDAHNVASVTAVDVLGGADGTVTASDETFVRIARPGIEIVKSAPATAHEGDVVTYSFAVTNTGNVGLAGVEVTDDVLGDVGTISSLDVDETQTLTKQFTVPEGDDDIVNIAEACGTDQLGLEVCDDDDHRLDPLHPAITLDKKVNGADHKPIAAALLAYPADALDYTIVIANTGDTSLEISSLADTLKGDVAAGCDQGVGSTLGVGESMECEYTLVAATDEHNVATVTAVDALGGAKGTVTASDETFVDVIGPAIQVVKSAATQAHEGDEVTYSFLVTNAGNVTLTDVEVTDDVLGVIGTIDELEAGASQTLTKVFTVPVGTAPIVNVATACGLDPLSNEVCDTDDHRLDPIHPAIAVVKTVDPPSVSAATGQATFTYVVTNTGDVRLAPVVVTDDVLGAIGEIASLDPGQSATLTRTATVSSATPRNVGTAVGTDPLGRQVSASDDAILTFVLPLRLPVTGAPLAAVVALGMLLIAAGLAVRHRLLMAR